MKANAHGLDWVGQKFSKSEFPEGVLEQMDARVIGALFSVRNNLPVNCPLYPSPVYGAHVRKNQTSRSRHNIIDVDNGGTRLSDATDFFCKREFAWQVWFTILKNSNINGIGVYQNAMLKGSTVDYTMFHIDTRPKNERAMWVALRDYPSEPFTYYSINQNHKEFFQGLAQGGLWE